MTVVLVMVWAIFCEVGDRVCCFAGLFWGMLLEIDGRVLFGVLEVLVMLQD